VRASGSHGSSSQDISADGASAELSWSFRCGDDDPGGRFHLVATTASEAVLTIDRAGGDAASSTLPGHRRYHVQVRSDCPWSVSVTS